MRSGSLWQDQFFHKLYASPQEVADALAPFAEGSDLASLAHKATASESDDAVDQSVGGTQESLKSGSVETDPTIDMPNARQAESSRRDGREESRVGRLSKAVTDGSGDSSYSNLASPTGSASVFTMQSAPTLSRPASPAPTARKEAGDVKVRPWYANRRNQIFAVAAALGGVILLGVITLFLQTKDGTIVVEIDDPEGLIQVTVDGQDIVITEKENAGEPIRLKPGDHKLNVSRSGLEFTTDKFTLRRGDKVVLSVRVVEGEVRVVQKDDQQKLLGRRRVDESPVQTGTRAVTWQPGPEENVLPGLVPRPAKFEGIQRWQMTTSYPRSFALSVAVSPDGTLIACGYEDREIRLYDADSLGLLRVFTGNQDIPYILAWNEDSDHLATGGAGFGNIHLWRKNGRLVRVLKGHDNGVRGLVWQSRSSLLSSGYDGTLRQWEVATGQSQTLFTGNRALGQVAWSPEPRQILFGSDSGTFRILDEEGQIQHSFEAHKEGNWPMLAVHPDGDRVAVGGVGYSVHLWKTDGTKIAEFKEGTGTAGNAYSLNWDESGEHLLSGWEYGHVSIHDANGTEVRTFTVNSEISVRCDWLGEDGAFALAGSRLTKPVHSSRIKQSAVSPDLPALAFRACQVSPDGQTIATGVAGGPVRFWSRDGELIRERSIDGCSHVLAMSWSPSGDALAISTGHDPFVRVWKEAGSGPEQRLHTGARILSLDWRGRDGRLAGANEKNVFIWESDGSLIKKLESPAECQGQVRWNGDGKRLAAVGRGTHLNIWSADGELDRSLPHEGPAFLLAWDPKNDRIITDAGVWDLRENKYSRHWSFETTPGRSTYLDDLLVDARGERFLASSHNTGRIFVWGLSGELQQELTGHQHDVKAIDFHDATSRLISVSDDHTIAAWNTDTWQCEWKAVQLPHDESITFNGAGQIINGHPTIVEDKLVVIVENEDGSLDLLKPSEFEKRISRSLTIEPYNTPAQHRALAEFVLKHGGAFELKEAVGRKVTSVAQLPDAEFMVQSIDQVFLTAENAEEFGAYLRKVRIDGGLALEGAVTDEVLRQLHGGTVRHSINVGGSSITDDGLRWLKDFETGSIVLRQTAITDDGMKTLADFPDLKTVKLNDTQIGDEGVRELVVNTGWIELSLVTTKITDKSLEYLASCRELASLSVINTNVTDAGVTELAKALPNCRITWDGGVIEPTTTTQTTPVWQPGDEENALPGLVIQPATLPGITRWQVETRYPRAKVNAMETSPDGSLVAVADDSGIVRLYSSEDGKLVRILAGHKSAVHGLAWSRDGSQLATAGADGIRIWTPTGETVLVISESDASTHEYGRIGWLPNGKDLWSGNHNGVYVWDSRSGRQVRSLALSDIDTHSAIRGPAWSPDGTRLVAGTSDGTIMIWDNDGTKLFEEKFGTYPARIAWSPDSQQFVAGDPKPMLFNKHGELKQELKNHHSCYAIAWNRDGTRFATEGHNGFRVWNADGTLQHEEIELRPSGAMAWSADGQSILSHVEDGHEKRLVNIGVSTNGELTWETLGTGFESSTSALAWSVDGKQILWGGYHSDLWIAQFPRGQVEQSFRLRHGVHVHEVKPRPGSQELAIAADWKFSLTSDGKNSTLKMNEEIEDLTSIEWNPDGTTTASCEAKKVVIRKPDDTEITTIELEHEVNDISWSPDGTQLAIVGEGGTAQIRNIDGTLVREFDVPDHWSIVAIAWDPKGEWITTGGSGGFRLWKLDGTPGPELDDPRISADCGWSPDGQYLATAGEHGVRLWNRDGSLDPVIDLTRTDFGGWRVAWSPDSRYLLTLGGYDELMVWDVQAGEPVLTMIMLSETKGVSFTPAGQILAGDPTTIENRLVYIVETEEGRQEVLTPTQFADRIGSSLFQDKSRDESDPVRQAANWIIEQGGWVDWEDDGNRDTNSADELPSGRFSIYTVGWSDTPLTAETLRELSTKVPPTLRIVNLQRAGITDEQLPQIRDTLVKGSAPFTIVLSGNPIKGSGLQHFAGLPLNWLVLSNTDVRDQHLKALGELNFRSLELDETVVTDAFLIHLKDHPGIHCLSLRATRVGDDGLQHLAGLSIDELRLDSTLISDKGLTHLSQLKHLGSLNVRKTNVTEAGVTALSKALPHCRIEWDGGVIGPDPNLVVAEWVFGHGGHVKTTHHGTIGSIEELPDEAFQIDYVGLGIGGEVTDRELKRFVGLRSLRGVELTGHSQITDAGMEVLASIDGLTSLALGGTGITDAGLQEIQKLDELRELQVPGTNITDNGVAYLANHQNLSKLALYDTDIGDASMPIIGRLPKLEYLTIHETQVTDEGIAHLLDLPLTWLSLNGTSTGNGALEQLSHIETLATLGIGTATLTDEGLVHLAKYPSLEVLLIKAHAEKITDAGMVHVAKLKRLKRLQLHAPGVTAAGLKTIAGMESLEYLDVGLRNMTDDWLIQLHSMKNLRSLWLNGSTRVTVEGIVRLMRALPECEVSSRGGIQKKVDAAKEKLPIASDPNDRPDE